MDNNKREMPAGIPFNKINRSNDIGSLSTGCLAGVRTKQAIMNPNTPEVKEQIKIVLNEQASCMNNPTIGPILIAVLFIKP